MLKIRNYIVRNVQLINHVQHPTCVLARIEINVQYAGQQK